MGCLLSYDQDPDLSVESVLERRNAGRRDPLAAVNSENDRSRDIQDSVSWNRGTHGFKFGARYLWFQAASAVRNGRNGFYQFSQGETGAVATSANGSQTLVAGTGDSFASFMLGAVESGSMSLAQPNRGNVQSLGLYAQDNWKISRRLTLNFHCF